MHYRKPDRLPGNGLPIKRYFTTEGVDPFDTVEWEKRSASITNSDGKVFFEQKDIEVPKSWSQLALNVVASKYFRGSIGDPKRENSVRHLIQRVVKTIAKWGWDQGYFNNEESARIFEDEVTYLCVHQMMAFNSPVWFNVGAEEIAQCSACFINSVKDDMGSILDLAKTEGMLFKYGSGTGSNLSTLRSKYELVTGGAHASGPVSFMKGYDAFAGVIKSGGKTRRAAKMVMLNVWHPDIRDFVWCKANEEKKAHALIDAGYTAEEAYGSIYFQNANNSVRVSDNFMQAAVEGRSFNTKLVRTSEVHDSIQADALLEEIAAAAHLCGDPGLQFDDTINKWHTCPNTDRINGSNPCSEYMFLDDSACNLASLNLRKFQCKDGTLLCENFCRAVKLTVLAQEILVDNSGYPTQKIAENSYNYRPLGLGYANLGAFLMAMGYPYDSANGRAYAAYITSWMQAQACLASAEMASVFGPFAGYESNQEAYLTVMTMHRNASAKIELHALVNWQDRQALDETWDKVLVEGGTYGFRNAQLTVLAPTGTIGFMMDCDTTGIEPDIALVKYKRLVGGGTLKIVNQTVKEALTHLGYDRAVAKDILYHIETTGTIEGAPSLRPEHLPVFDCAFRAEKGTRSIHYMGHIRMMAACQPFLSGAISKTVNMPNDATVKDVKEAYFQSWKLGLKAVAIYRDGCKRMQPLSTTQAGAEVNSKTIAELVKPQPHVAIRTRLDDERDSKTFKFSIGGHEGYIHAGMYPDGKVGEVFVKMAKEGSTVSGLADMSATLISLLLQYSVPLKVITDKLIGSKFEPAGFTNHPRIRRATSIGDFLGRWLNDKFGKPEEAEQTGTVELRPRVETDAPTCHECGDIMVRSGACHKCMNCGATSGCS